MNRLTLVLLFLAAGLAFLIFNNDGGEFLGLSNTDLGYLIYLVPIATLLAAGTLTSRQHLGRNLGYIAIWSVVAVALVVFYVFKDDAQHMTSRVAAELMPGHPMVLTEINGQSEVVIRKNHVGHFAVNAHVDGHRLGMLIDTGASQVALTWNDAERIGLDPEKLSFTLPITTANGTGKAAEVKLAKLSIGPIVRHNVSATVAEKGKLDSSLLGMNFLSSLSAVRMEPYEMRLLD